MNSERDEMEEMKAKLAKWFEQKLPEADNIAITEFEKPGMGLSSETFLLTLDWEESGEKKSQGMVLRSAPQDYKIFPDYELSHQFRIMQILENTNVDTF